MDKNSLLLDFYVKITNLCRFLQSEKNEHLLSQKLFDVSSSLSETCCILSSPALGKVEKSSLRKDASLLWDKTLFYLNAVFASLLISEAQKDSMVQTLNLLKKEINI